MRWQDIPDLAALEGQLFGSDAWSEQTWWQELAGRPRRDYVVAVDAVDRAVGYAGLDLGGEIADVMTIAVATDARGRGLGKRLLDRLVESAVASGAAYLMLEVRADNGAARRLYERNGFCLLTIRPRYYQPGEVDALVLRRALSQAPE